MAKPKAVTKNETSDITMVTCDTGYRAENTARIILHWMALRPGKTCKKEKPQDKDGTIRDTDTKYSIPTIPALKSIDTCEKYRILASCKTFSNWTHSSELITRSAEALPSSHALYFPVRFLAVLLSISSPVPQSEGPNKASRTRDWNMVFNTHLDQCLTSNI